MTSRTANGRWIYLESADDRGVSAPEPLTYNVGGTTKAELLAVLEAIKRFQSMVDGTSVEEEDHVRDIAVSRGIDNVPFELYQGRLRAHLRWEDYVQVLIIGLLIVDMDGSFTPFGIDSQVAALLGLLSIDTKELGVAEEDFFDHMWASRHEAWIRLVINAVRCAWADRVTIRTEVQEADMV